MVTNNHRLVRLGNDLQLWQQFWSFHRALHHFILEGT
jgi:hypothetical protein